MRAGQIVRHSAVVGGGRARDARRGARIGVGGHRGTLEPDGRVLLPNRRRAAVPRPADGATVRAELRRRIVRRLVLAGAPPVLDLGLWRLTIAPRGQTVVAPTGHVRT